MAGLALAMKVDRDALVARSKADRRRYRRVSVDIPGKVFVPAESHEADCRVIDLSPGGAQVVTDFVPPLDTPIVIYVDGFGRFEGTVARPPEGAESREGTFGIKFNCSPMKRERIAEQLMLLMNRGIVDESVMRRHDRTPTKGATSFTRANGVLVQCEVLDLSLSGVSLKTDDRPPVGEVVVIGQMAGRVVRHHETGVAVEFTKPRTETPRLAASQ